jgi:hypothetical protein
MNTKTTLGRISRPHLTVENTDNGGLKVAVVEGQSKDCEGNPKTLVGYAYIGPCDDGDGYKVYRLESWKGPENRIPIMKTVLRCLTVPMFEKLMAP